MYRDGVSEGEFGLVLLHELSAIKQAAEELGGSPRTTFCVVQKRHAVRLFPTSAADGDRRVRPPPSLHSLLPHHPTARRLFCAHQSRRACASHPPLPLPPQPPQTRPLPTEPYPAGTATACLALSWTRASPPPAASTST